MSPQPATKEDVGYLRQDLQTHIQDDKDFQDRLFEWLGRRFDKLDSLWDDKNQRLGEQNAKKTGSDTDKEKKRDLGDWFKWGFDYALTVVIAVATVKMVK